MTPTQVSGGVATVDVGFGSGALEAARTVDVVLDFFVLVDAVRVPRLTGEVALGVLLLCSANTTGVASCPSRLFFVTPIVSTTKGSI